MSTHTSPTYPEPGSRADDLGCRIDGCGDTGWKAQFGRPAGIMGSLVGHLMAIKNAPMNRFALELLALHPEDRVLEIGFGPGTLLASIASRVPRGMAAGIDPSAVMLGQAARRTRRFRADGRVRLMLGSVNAIPVPPDSFTRVVAVNSFHHWESREAGLTELRRVLRPGGLLVLVLRREHPTRTRLVAPGHSLEEIEAAERLLAWVGFRDVRRQTRRLGRETVGIMARA